MMTRILFLLSFFVSSLWATVTIPEERAMEQIESALLDNTDHEEVTISYARNIPPFEIGTDESDELVIQDLAIRGYRFIMKVYPVGHPELMATVSGQMMPLMPVPVLNRTVMPGDVITAQDLTWKSTEVRLINKSTLTTENEIVNTTPRHKPLMAGLPIKRTDVHKPHLVKRGDKITIYYEDGPVYITGSAEALENGSEGDAIRILNTTSRKTLSGRVTGLHQVRVER